MLSAPRATQPKLTRAIPAHRTRGEFSLGIDPPWRPPLARRTHRLPPNAQSSKVPLRRQNSSITRLELLLARRDSKRMSSTTLPCHIHLIHHWPFSANATRSGAARNGLCSNEPAQTCRTREIRHESQ